MLSKLEKIQGLGGSFHRHGHDLDAGERSITPQISADEVFAFGPFHLLATERLLVSAGQPVTLGSRALNLLFTLVQHAGELVSKETLISSAWSGSHVEEATLRVHIAALRRALKDGQGGARYIQNETGRGYRFVASVLREAGETGLPGIAAPPCDKAPPPRPKSITRVIGRGSTIEALALQIEVRRCLTLAGPGGIGKTTVAHAIADRLSPDYRDGVCFVDLAPACEPKAVHLAVSNALGLDQPREGKRGESLAFLKERHMLLILDNCEHVIEEVAYIVEIVLSTAPNIHIVATSREPLRADGEWVHRLAPLETPEEGRVMLALEALTFPAIELFVERASAREGFQLTDADVHDIVTLCQKLDGIPLAIELAAVRTGVFGVAGLIAALDDRLAFLSQGRRTAPARQQTLCATLDWSYDLLRPVEQTVLMRLSVCAGRFEADTAIAVAADEMVMGPEVIDALAELAAKSLVVVHRVGKRAFYRLLNTTRWYARDKLQDCSDSCATRRRHALHIRAAVTEARRRALGPDAEHSGPAHLADDIDAALRWCFGPQGDRLLGLSLVAHSALLSCPQSYLHEHRSWCERAVLALEGMPPEKCPLQQQLRLDFFAALHSASDGNVGAAAIFERVASIADQRLHFDERV